MGQTPTNIQEEEHPHTQIYSCNTLNSKPFEDTDLTATIAQNTILFLQYICFGYLLHYVQIYRSPTCNVDLLT